MIDIKYNELVCHRGSVHNDGETVGQHLKISPYSMKMVISYYRSNSDVHIDVLLTIQAFDSHCNSFGTVIIPVLYYEDLDGTYNVDMSSPNNETFTDFITIKNDKCRVSTHQGDGIYDITFSLEKITFFNKYFFGMYWKDFIEQSFCNYQITIEK